MIAAPILIVGILLVLTALFAARIPGEASFASSGIPFAPRHEGAGARDPIRAFFLSPIHPATWNAVLFVVVGFVIGVVAFASIVSAFSAGVASILAGIGIVLIVLGIEGSRFVARLERRRGRLADPEPLLAHPYKPLRGGLMDLVRAEFVDEARWRDVLYVGVNFPLVVIEFVLVVAIWSATLALLSAPLWEGVEPAWTLVAVLVGVILLPIAASLSQLVAILHRAVISGLICTSETRELRRQVETLRESRSAVLDAEAGELRRIERDLHDGAQQRLVMLTIDLGLASERIDSDPAAAKELVLEARDEAQRALAELRSLVRGIAPAILLDRGLCLRSSRSAPAARSPPACTATCRSVSDCRSLSNARRTTSLPRRSSTWPSTAGHTDTDRDRRSLSPSCPQGFASFRKGDFSVRFPLDLTGVGRRDRRSFQRRRRAERGTDPRTRPDVEGRRQGGPDRRARQVARGPRRAGATASIR